MDLHRNSLVGNGCHGFLVVGTVSNHGNGHIGGGVVSAVADAEAQQEGDGVQADGQLRERPLASPWRKAF